MVEREEKLLTHNRLEQFEERSSVRVVLLGGGDE
jgi:hypothetical protein